MDGTSEGRAVPAETEPSVCSRCVDDDALQALLARNADTIRTCHFCGGEQAADFDTFLEAFMRGLHREFNNVDDEGVGYDSREGGYQWSGIRDSWDLISDEFSDVLIGEGLVEAVQRSMEPCLWIKKDFVEPHRDEALMDSWQDFRQAIRHKTRYVFWQRPRSHEDELRGAGEIPPEQILQRIGDLISALDLVRRLSPEERLWRARVHAHAERVRSAADLGTVPQHLCNQSNRMSPAGIPMFYGALTAGTALQEAMVRPGHAAIASLGAFTCSHEVNIVDFTDLPQVPSLFDPELGDSWRQVRFLHAFVEELAQEVRPSYEEIDYVPTQVVTEYLLHAWGAGAPIAGLKYRSARTGKPCVVLNVRSEHCLDVGSAELGEGGLRLLLQPDSVHQRPLPSRRKSLKERRLHSPHYRVRLPRRGGRTGRR
ncbi:HEPN-associated N-terminal domain-containing protein [Streptomyces sp. 8N114]|uniref:HEPN-associated N-terminal domain-containing protein n=1 Tax=Streptomyces sp. 8N114 TaxID=3457419 RepID=UPI003FD137E2